MNQLLHETTLGIWEISDLRIIQSEEFVDDENGEICCCIYSFSVDAVSFVGEDVIKILRERGIQVLDDLPTS